MLRSGEGAHRWSRLGGDLSIMDPTQPSDKSGEGAAALIERIQSVLSFF